MFEPPVDQIRRSIHWKGRAIVKVPPAGRQHHPHVPLLSLYGKNSKYSTLFGMGWFVQNGAPGARGLWMYRAVLECRNSGQERGVPLRGIRRHARARENSHLVHTVRGTGVPPDHPVDGLHRLAGQERGVCPLLASTRRAPLDPGVARHLHARAHTGMHLSILVSTGCGRHTCT